MFASHPATSFTDQFATIMGGLCGALAVRMSRPLSLRQRDAFPLLMLLWTRLRRMTVRFAALAARLEAGLLPPPPARPTGTARSPGKSLRLPRGFGWLCRLLPLEVAGFGSQLHHVLSNPEMQAILAASPHLAGMLRPVCRMLGAPALPPPQRAARAQRPPPTPKTAWRRPPDRTAPHAWVPTDPMPKPA